MLVQGHLDLYSVFSPRLPKSIGRFSAKLSAARSTPLPKTVGRRNPTIQGSSHYRRKLQGHLKNDGARTCSLGRLPRPPQVHSVNSLDSHSILAQSTTQCSMHSAGEQNDSNKRNQTTLGPILEREERPAVGGGFTWRPASAGEAHPLQVLPRVTRPRI